MINIEQPDDLISLSLHNILTYRINDKKFIRSVKNWNKKIVLHIDPFYPVTVIFDGMNIKFARKEEEDFDLKLKIHINIMLDIAYGRLAPTTAIEEKKMELIGIEKDPKLMPKFFNIFVTSMNMVAQEPNLKFYELNKETR
ncbi:MAG: SCP2 sterol-binding domain-containing protein [Promethearchaeota archaeon]|jgi:putative sterol carrier protein